MESPIPASRDIGWRKEKEEDLDQHDAEREEGRCVPIKKRKEARE